MKKNSLIYALCFSLCASFFAQEIMKHGDFAQAADDLLPECYGVNCKVSKYMEDLTWNQCGRVEITQVDHGPFDTVSCKVFWGGDYSKPGEIGGYPCKPNTTYQFSIDLRGDIPVVFLRGYIWTKKNNPVNPLTLQTTINKVNVRSEWVNFKGTFTTGDNAEFAALGISIWESTKYNPLRNKVGSYLLFDNVSIQEKAANPLFSNQQNGLPELKTIKTACTANYEFSDFQGFKSKNKPQAETRVKISSDDKAIRMHIECDEPLKIITATQGKRFDLWSGDVVEIFFAPKSGDRLFSQFVFGPNGNTYTGNGSPGTVQYDWEVKAAKTAQGWSGAVVIPFASLGWSNPKAGEWIGFNVCRQRRASKELTTWSYQPLAFNDVAHFGRLILGNYPDRMTREEYEASMARQEAITAQDKLNRLKQQKLLVAPVSITSDFSVPYMPDELLSAPDKLEVAAAVNEIKPLAVAVANMTDITTEYRVVVEIRNPNSRYKRDWDDGLPFPGVTIRKALRIRDDTTGNNPIYDPLPKLDEASSIMIPPKETALLWLDFNTFDMPPGKIDGWLRLIPLNGKGIFTQDGKGFGNYKYDSDMKDIPLTLNVRNIVLSKEPARPADYFVEYKDSAYPYLYEAGMRIFTLTPWSFQFPYDEKTGEFILQPKGKSAGKAEKAIIPALAKGHEKFFVGYGCYSVFTRTYGNDKKNLWGKWLKAVRAYVKTFGVKPENCYMEIFDEAKNVQETLEVMKAAQEAAPEFIITLTLGGYVWTAEEIRLLHPYVDHWILSHNRYLTRADHLAYIEWAKTQGKTFSHYSAPTQVRASLDREFRRAAWIGERMGADNDNFYAGYDGTEGTAWKGNPGGGLLYYRYDACVPSMRFMALRQGMMDVKYLAKLREVGKDSPEAQAFLKTAATRVCIDFSHDPTTADKVRDEAAELILKLQKPLELQP
ncbi:MAG: hypothetical protein WCT05_03550 [Lentisphaeria bacterium]